MIRILAPLGAVLVTALPADAQLIRPGRPQPQPAGVILPPQLPVGSAGTPRPNTPPLRGPGTFPTHGLLGLGGYYPYYPYYPWDVPGSAPAAPTVINNYIPVPTAVPASTPPELRARLTLDIPFNSKVWLGGKVVDAGARPLIVESPVLKSGQTYTFDVKVTWREGDKTEERTKTVTVDAGRGATVTYFGGR
jgi:uncharacterized protein (TIGR03000 family)